MPIWRDLDGALWSGTCSGAQEHILKSSTPDARCCHCMPRVMGDILEAIFRERAFQNEKWFRRFGLWDIPRSEKLSILMEEVGEVAKALNETPMKHETQATHDEWRRHLAHELVQVAAVAVAWLEVDGREP